jgi:cell division protein FtsL
MVFTPFQEKVKKIFFVLFAFFAVVISCEAIALVTLYNNSVNIRHEISRLRSEKSILESRNSEIKDAVFAILDSTSIESFAVSRGMVKEGTPSYLRVDFPWLLASFP